MDTQHFFAFSGFASSSDPFEIFEATRGLIVQLLGDFSLEVHGVAPHQGGLAVAVQYYASQGEASELKVTELKDLFKYQGSVLFTVNVEDHFVAAFEKPPPRAGQPQVQTPLLPGASAGIPVDFVYFAFRGFENKDSDYKIYVLIREYMYDVMGDFAVEVIGVHQDHVGLRVPRAQVADAMKSLHDKRDQFVFKGQVLSTVDVDPTLARAFAVPHAPVPVVPPGPSPLRASPNRRLVQKVFETTSVPPGLPDTPVLPGGSSDDKLDKVLTSLGELTTCIKTEVVTRSHLD